MLDDDREYIDAINEASHWSTANSMRKLFVILLTANLVNRPENVWNHVWHHLCEDVQFNKRKMLKDMDLCLSDDEKKNLGLLELDRLLQMYNKCLKDYPDMPIPNYDDSLFSNNRLLFDELNYDRQAMTEEYETMEKQLTDEQLVVYETVLSDIQHQKGGLFFVYGYGGTGKTFVWKALSSKLRSTGDIVLNVASSGIASLLLPGGRTAHSRFAIPIAINEDSTCNICQGSQLAELLIQAKLIIWDEAPMMHKHCFEALDKTMRDLLRHCDPNSVHKWRQRVGIGKTVVLGVTSGKYCLTLDDSARKEHIERFAAWLADIGNGILGGPNDGHGKVEIPEEMLLPSNGDYISTIVDTIFPMFRQGGSNLQQMENRAILAPTLDVVNEVNEYMSGLHVLRARPT
ncbi:uncharacterized protein LOC116023609 [Ipomoea triloba]|uniref:uncharacterized protein LOC116023609 n=1 Tax=Ipomoea triloba TaxID=35885 RepID=UPI00125D0AE3|nr:uncharacterized protein LOC116023609 [Ipomoea triloba]